jgi:hypothetical protein
MSHSVHFDSDAGDDARRAALYDGDLFVYARRDAVRRYAEFAAGLIREAFHPLDPELAQYDLPVERYAQILGELKPRFIHHPKSKEHLRAILADLGCDAGQTYFDVPRLRSSTSDKYLTSGIAYAWHPHRDTWYSAPSCQVNYWMPVFELASTNAMAFHPAYWNRGVENSSRDYNYYVWNKTFRGPDVAKLVTEDPRPLPRATAVELDPQLRLLCPVGGILVFSGAQMHSSVPNTSGRTRFSIDFRTVHLGDAQQRRGAPRTDEACTGTTMRDYLRCTDLSRLPDDVVALYDDGTAAAGLAIYEPGRA